jgi:Tetratricopeptide repeat.
MKTGMGHGASVTNSQFPMPDAQLKLYLSNFQNMTEQANGLLKQGISQYQAHQFEAALDSWRSALILYQEVNDKRRSGAALGNMGVAYEALSDYAQAIECYQQHLDLAIEIGDRRGEANALGNLGNACCAREDFDSAISYQQQRLAIARETGDSRGGRGSFGQFGLLLRCERRFPGSDRMLSAAVGDRTGKQGRSR